MTEKIGAAAYRLDLPLDCLIHLVFHVLQLKPFTADYSPVFAELPASPDLSTISLHPEAILERRLVKKGNEATPQIRVKWQGLAEDHTTWEDYNVLRARFPLSSLWDGASSSGGDSVTPPP